MRSSRFCSVEPLPDSNTARRGVCGMARRSAEYVLAVEAQRGDRLADIVERQMGVALLRRRWTVRVRAPHQFLHRADVDVAVVQRAVERRHVARQEAAILMDRVAAQRRAAVATVLAHEGERLRL